MKRREILLIKFICILSFFLYYFAPYGIYPYYCGCVAILYILDAYFVCRLDWNKKLYLSFNTLFALSFFLTSFGFAIFVQDTTAETLSVLAGKTVDFNLMPKCCSLCLIAYSLYSYYYIRKINVTTYSDQAVLSLPKIYSSLAISLFYFSFIILFIKTFLFFKRTGDINMNEDTFLVSIFQCMLPVAFIFRNAKRNSHNLIEFLKNNFVILLPTILVMALFLIMGDRGIIIVCSLTILMVYVLLVKRVNFLTLGCIAVVGVLLMFAVRQTRISDSALSSGSFSSFANASNNAFKEADGLITFFADLTGAVQELCLGYQYKQQHGMLAPIEQIVMLPTYPFPLIPTLVASVMFGKIPSDYGTGEQINNFVSPVGEGHFGNHVVIDIYMRWGILGVIIIFPIFGYFIANTTNKMKTDLKYLAIYFVLVGLAVYTPRNTIPFLIRPISYSYFFIWYLTRKRIVK